MSVPEIVKVLGTAKSPIDVYNWELTRSLDQILQDIYFSLSAIRLCRAWDIIDPGDHNGLALTAAQLAAAIKKIVDELKTVPTAAAPSPNVSVDPWYVAAKLCASGYSDFCMVKTLSSGYWAAQDYYTSGVAVDDFRACATTYDDDGYMPGLRCLGKKTYTTTYCDQDYLSNVLSGNGIVTLIDKRSVGYAASAYVLFFAFKTKFINASSYLPLLVLYGTSKNLAICINENGRILIGVGTFDFTTGQFSTLDTSKLIDVDTTTDYYLVYVMYDDLDGVYKLYILDKNLNILDTEDLGTLLGTAVSGIYPVLVLGARYDVGSIGYEFDWVLHYAT